MKNLKLKMIALLLLNYGLTAQSQMLTAQGNLLTLVTVQEICELNATPVNFGVIDFVRTNGSMSVPGYLSVRCTKGVVYKLKVSQEGVQSNGYRALKNRDNNNLTAKYNLYILGTNNIFGDGAVGNYIEGIGDGLLNQVKYEAKIEFDQTVAAGFYEDIVNIMIDY